MNLKRTLALALLLTRFAAADPTAPELPKNIQLVLDTAKPLAHPRGDRLPLYLWPAMDPGPLSDAAAEQLVRDLDARGVGLICSWNAGSLEKTLTECLPVARAQKKLDVPINIGATSLMGSFCDGSSETAHLDDTGQPFFDDTFGPKTMGCPFRLEHRIAPIRERMKQFIGAYAKEQLPISFMFTDWEIDGPLEWNRALDASKRCKVCREHVPDLDTNFLAYQDALRRLRSGLQREAYAEPVLEAFPKALVGNYAISPNDGWRYWYDYFEKYVPGQPALSDQRAHYRHWSNDFPATGFTYAMPVIYPWSWEWNWYDFQPGDYRWFYAGLLEASSVGQNTPANVPIITFVHWHTVDVGRSVDDGAPKDAGEPAQQMSEHAYQELLWHMLLRGTDTFILWCQADENAKEVELLHPVWAAAQEYGDFLEHGTPITFDVSKQPGPVVSALRLGNKILVRRTDFDAATGPVALRVGEMEIQVPRLDDRCQVISLVH